MPRPNKLGKRIRLYLKEQGVTQNEFAQSTGIAQSFVSGLVNGHKQNITVNRLDRIRRVIGCDIDDLIG